MAYCGKYSSFQQHKAVIMENYVDELDKHFTSPKNISPFYDTTRIPRKSKKRVKNYCRINWSGLDNGQRLWYYLGNVNPDYQRFLIKKITEKYNGK